MSQLKRALFTELAQIGKVLSSSQRIEILDYLAQAPRGVEELSQLTGLTMANTSRHLQVMKSAFLVTVEKRGKQRIYHLAGDEVVALMRLMRRTAENHLAQVQEILAQYPDHASQLEPMKLEDLSSALEKEEVVVLDVRPPEEFKQGHIPKAINVPPDQLETMLQMLPKDKRIVAYCRGPYCVYSHEAVQWLQEHGFQAHRLEEGMPEWRLRGFPVEKEEKAS